MYEYVWLYRGNGEWDLGVGGQKWGDGAYTEVWHLPMSDFTFFWRLFFSFLADYGDYILMVQICSS